MHILIVENEQNVARMIDMKLRSVGFTTYLTAFGEEALDLVRHYSFDLILLDLSLPDVHGYDILRQLRSARIATPVLVLADDVSDDTLVKCFGLGADDYVTKPYRANELVARIRAVVRRCHGHDSSTLRVGEIAIDLEASRAKAAGVALCLTRREYQILEILALRKGSTVSKDAILTRLYGGRDEPVEQIIDVYVCKLRKKIAEVLGKNDYIVTIRGGGYGIYEPDLQVTEPHVTSRHAPGPATHRPLHAIRGGRSDDTPHQPAPCDRHAVNA